MSVDRETIARMVRSVLRETRITDIHTHLYSPAFGRLLLAGIDELLTYHYLVAEALRWLPMSPEAFWRLDKRAQADLVWRTLFRERSPLSESCRGVVAVIEALGLDADAADLAPYREFFARQDVAEHVGRVFDLAGVESAVMTNDPFDDEERPLWLAGPAHDPRFRAALRLDGLLNDWETAVPKLRSWGFDVRTDLGGPTVAEVRRFLADWAARTEALYLAVSLPPSFAYPESSVRAKLLEVCVLPAAVALGIPLALMIGVKRGVNPALRLAGDGMGRADVGAVESLCRAFPENRFLVTLLSRENQHELCVVARKFRNLMIFGGWWFLSGPTLVREITRMRLDLLGLSFIPQHSDARVLEQLIYKWGRAKAVVADVLTDAYADLVATGRTITLEEVRRDAAALFGANFRGFLDSAKGQSPDEGPLKGPVP